MRKYALLALVALCLILGTAHSAQQPLAPDNNTIAPCAMHTVPAHTSTTHCVNNNGEVVAR